MTAGAQEAQRFNSEVCLSHQTCNIKWMKCPGDKKGMRRFEAAEPLPFLPDRDLIYVYSSEKQRDVSSQHSIYRCIKTRGCGSITIWKGTRPFMLQITDIVMHNGIRDTAAIPPIFNCRHLTFPRTQRPSTILRR